MKKLLILSVVVISLFFMQILAVSSKDAILIAHRGVPTFFPEHTLPSYKKAVELDADYIEIDLRMTKDGHIVSFHDKTLDRTTNGVGDISSFTLSELKKLDAGSWFSSEFAGEQVLTIEEIIDSFGDDTNYYIETRLVNEKPVMEEKLLEVLSKKDVLDNTVIQSFSPESLQKVKAINNEIPLTLLLFDRDVPEVNFEQVKNYADNVGPNGDVIDEKFVDDAHAQGLGVHVWFYRDKEKQQMEQILSYGVDGVFTDYLENTLHIEQ